ncbi:MAG: hypothetical protein ACI9O1_001149, partial [Candidatus Thalassarchaeaceae archaeon]
RISHHSVVHTFAYHNDVTKSDVFKIVVVTRNYKRKYYHALNRVKKHEFGPTTLKSKRD